MKTHLLIILAGMSMTMSAQAAVSLACQKEVTSNRLVIQHPGYSDDIELVRVQLAKKLNIKPKQLEYSQSTSFGDGAAHFNVVVFKVYNNDGSFKGYYSVTAVGGTMIVNVTLITS